MTALEKVPIPFRGFEDNAAFLEAKFDEVALQLECAGLRRQLGQRGRRRWLEGLRSESGETIPAEKLQQRLDISERRLLHHRAVVESRLQVSDPSVIPVLDLVERCRLSAFDQQALWLLFFKAVSPEFRAHYEQLGLSHRRSEGDDELCIGNLLEVLCQPGVASSVQARARFSVDAPLMAHHLLRTNSTFDVRPSILDVEVRLPQRVVAWISGDPHRYANDSPCLVEWSTEDIRHVVLDNGLLERLLRMVDHHQEFRTRRVELGMADGISYGSGLAILEYGPPGTGKTLLARALANRLGQPLVSLVAKERGHTCEADVEYLFREARLQEGIAFIDECESLCSAHSEELRALLRELEQFDGIAIMATNRPQELVPQLDRRFTVKVPFALPSAAARQRIWELHLGHTPLAPDVDLERLAREYPIAGGYIKNAAQTAVNEALGREGELRLAHDDLDAACRLQEQHVGGGLDRGRRYRPQLRVDDLLVSADLRQRLRNLAQALERYGEVLRALGGAEDELPNGVRVLFHGKDFHAAMSAAEAVAGQIDRRLVRYDLHDLVAPSLDRTVEWSPAEAMEAAVSTGQIAMVTDARGRLGDPEKEDVGLLWALLAGKPRQIGIVFVVSSARRVSRHRWGSMFHQTLDVTGGDAETRAHQWRRLLGAQAQRVDVGALAEAFVATPSEMRMALERAALMAAGEGEATVTDARLRAAMGDVLRRSTGEGLFG